MSQSRIRSRKSVFDRLEEQEIACFRSQILQAYISCPVGAKCFYDRRVANEVPYCHLLNRDTAYSREFKLWLDTFLCELNKDDSEYWLRREFRTLQKVRVLTPCAMQGVFEFGKFEAIACNRRLYIAELQDWIAKLEKYKSNRNKTALVAAEFRSKASSILGGFAPLGTDPTEDHSAEVERVLTLLQSELYKSKQSLKAREYQRGSYIDCILRNLPKRRRFWRELTAILNFSTIVLLDETTRPYQDRLTEDSIRHEASRGESTNDSSPKQDFVRECMEGIVPGLYERLENEPLTVELFQQLLEHAEREKQADGELRRAVQRLLEAMPDSLVD